jgi:hypothetical protein
VRFGDAGECGGDDKCGVFDKFRAPWDGLEVFKIWFFHFEILTSKGS